MSENDADQVPRCKCGARILTPPDMECPLCAMRAADDLRRDVAERWREALDLLGKDWPHDGLDPHHCEFNRQGSCTYPGCYAVDE